MNKLSVLFSSVALSLALGFSVVSAQETITVWTQFGDDDGERFKEAMAPFEEEFGVEVVVETSQDTAALTIRAQGGNLPDAVLFPQPGLMADFVAGEYLVPLSTVLDMEAVEADYSETWLNLGSVDGELYAIPYRTSMKSLVWYAKDDFEAAGYAIPDTWDELMALSDQIIADGGTPWCIGLESGAASGWPGTDWIEDIMLRTVGGDGYDAWVAGDLDFTSDEVRRAFDLFGSIVLDPEQNFGGPITSVTTFFGDAMLPMFEEEPGCYMHRQASFIIGYLPEEVTTDLENQIGIFYFPPIDEEHGSPVLGAGNMTAITNDREIVVEYMRYMATAESVESFLKQGNFIGVNQSIPAEWYPDDLIRTQADIVLNADTFRFDGSDLMPGEVGTGSFWSEMMNWVGGQDLDTTLNNIENSWPE